MSHDEIIKAYKAALLAYQLDSNKPEMILAVFDTLGYNTALLKKGGALVQIDDRWFQVYRDQFYKVNPSDLIKVEPFIFKEWPTFGQETFK